jgi:hypothetical protein
MLVIYTQLNPFRSPSYTASAEYIAHMGTFLTVVLDAMFLFVIGAVQMLPHSLQVRKK